MDMTFNNEGSHWIAEFVVDGDFNLHIERNDNGFLYVQQRTSDTGEYDSVNGANFAVGDKVIDCDFSGHIYPKHIKVVSQVRPTIAVVTFA